jgi:hypothetical protein
VRVPLRGARKAGHAAIALLETWFKRLLRALPSQGLRIGRFQLSHLAA